MKAGRPSKGGAHKVTVKGVDYWYAWKGKGAPRLYSEPGSPRFQVELNKALQEAGPTPVPGLIVREATTFGDVARAYLASEKFTSKAGRTKSDYREHIDALCAKFGTLGVAALHENPDETRGDFLDWCDELAKRGATLANGDLSRGSKRQALYAWSVLNIVLNWGKQRGKLKLMYGCPRSRKVFYEWLGRVIGCGHVSGLRCGCYMPRAGMEMRGPGADQSGEL